MHAKECRARALLHIAARIIELSAGLVFQRHGLLDAVLYGKACKQRHVHHHANLGGVGARASGQAGGHKAIGVAIDGIAGLQVDGWLVAGFGFFRIELGNVQCQLGLAQLGLAGQCGIDPALHIVWRDIWQSQWRGKAGGDGADAAHQLVKCDVLDLQIILRGDLLRRDQIKACLRFARIGDGGSTDLEIALGHFQLGVDGLLLRLGHLHIVLRSQYVEVGLRHAHDQVLRSAVDLGLRHIHAALALLIGDLVGRAVQRLLSAELQVLHRVVDAGADLRQVDFGMRAVHSSRQPHAGQEARQGLIGTASGCAGISLLGLP